MSTHTWVMANHGMHGNHATDLHRTEHEGVVFVTASDMQVYASFPMLNLLTGEMDELWLLKEQYENYRNNREAKKPHSRFFELHTIGLPTHEEYRAAQAPHVEGYVHPSSSHSVIQDKGGHWWSGTLFDRVTCRHYFEDSTLEDGVYHPPELKFVYPWLQYLGADDDEMWLPKWHSRQGEKERLFLCSREVAKAIGEMGVWGIYCPQGAARTDVDLAKSEASVVRAAMVDGMEDRLKALEEKSANSESRLTTAIKDKEKAEEAAGKTLDELTQLQKEAVDKTMVAQLRLRTKELEERCGELEADLAAARSGGSGGLPWSSL